MSEIILFSRYNPIFQKKCSRG